MQEDDDALLEREAEYHAKRFADMCAENLELRDKIDRLCLRIGDAELALNHWDASHVSEYWLRYRHAV